MRWLFWDFDVDALDVDAHEDAVLARVLENGRLEDVRYPLERFGERRIDFVRSPYPPLDPPRQELGVGLASVPAPVRLTTERGIFL